MSVWRDPSRLADPLAALSWVTSLRRSFGLLSWGTFLRSSTFLVGLAILGYACSRLASGFSLPAFEAAIAHAGPWGAWFFLALATGAIAVGAPRQAIAFAGAYLFGFWPGLALSLASSTLSAALDLAWARGVGRATVQRRIGGRLAKIDHFLANNPFTTSLMLRLLPIGNNVLINLAAGISGMSAGWFLLGSTLGYAPQSVVFALLGAGTKLGRGPEIAVAIGLIGVSAVLGMVLLHRRMGSCTPFGLLRKFSAASSDDPDAKDRSRH